MLKVFSILALASLAAGQPTQSPPVPDITIDLRTQAGVDVVAGRWRYADAHVVETDHRAPGPDLKPTGAAVRTHTVHPRLGTPDFDLSPWAAVDPAALESRRTNGRLAFGWYRLEMTMPGEVNGRSTAGMSAVLELVVDDYAEVWVGGSLDPVLGQSDGPTIAGWNSPVRVPISPDVRAGQKVEVAIFAANGPLSDPPPNYVWIRSATLDLYTSERANVPVEVTRHSPAFDEIVPEHAVAERLASGFGFAEGPVWVPRLTDGRTYGGGGPGGYLLFSDPNQNTIHRWDPATRGTSIFRTKSGFSGGIGDPNIGEFRQPGSNGLALDGQGRLTICEHGNRRVTRLEPNGTLTVLADRFEGKRLNSPNDLVYRSDGTLFFTDPPFGLPLVFDDPRKELAHSGVYALKGGTLRLAATDLAAPNGLAFSPDEKHLYVANWEESRKVILRYDVASDASLSNPALFFDMTSTTGEICLDGLKVDSRGNVYASGPGGIWVIAPDSTHLGTIALPELAANFAFGGDDARTLYCCARSGVYALRLGVPGAAR